MIYSDDAYDVCNDNGTQSDREVPIPVQVVVVEGGGSKGEGGNSDNDCVAGDASVGQKWCLGMVLMM